MGKRTSRYVFTFRIACLIAGFSLLAPQAVFAQDLDYDDLADTLEMDLAQRFFPQVRYHQTDSCIGPLPRPVVFRARYLSVGGQRQTNPYIIGITYVLLYDEDCGVPPTGHRGDNEPIHVFLFWNGMDWEFASVSATAHWGPNPCENRTASINRDNVIWVSKNKHGNFATRAACGGIFCDNNCGLVGMQTEHTFYNAGEPGAHSDPTFTDALWRVRENWVNQYVWSGFFFDSSPIFDKLYLSRYAYLTFPNPDPLCLDDCLVSFEGCILGYPLEQCELRYIDCMDRCNRGRSWDW